MNYPRSLATLLLRLRPALLGQWAKRILCWRRQVVIVPAGRFWVDLASNFGLRVTSSEGYEPETARALLAFLSPGMVFVDLGANEGFFSVLASRQVGPMGRVFAIEPQSRLTAVLRRNLELNDASNVTLAVVAISDTSGAAEFNLAPDTNSGSSGLARATRYANPTQSVRTLTLDGFLAEYALASIDVMKIDIEGFEYEAVLGSPDVFRQRRVRCLLIEIHDALLAKRSRRSADIVDFLLDCGYRRTACAGFEAFIVPS